MSFWISRTSISFASSSWTRRSRSTGSTSSSTSCALSTFKSRFDATRSASRAGSSRFEAIATRSCEMFFPSETTFSSADFTFRISASSSTESGITCGSVFGWTFAVRYGCDSSKYSTFAARKALHENAHAAIGQFEHPHDDGDRAELMQIVRPLGSSTLGSFCATSMIIRFSASD